MQSWFPEAAMVDIEDFSHHGMHAENDDRQAAMTLMLVRDGCGHPDHLAVRAA
jgi:hypothetical protein